MIYALFQLYICNYDKSVATLWTITDQSSEVWIHFSFLREENEGNSGFQEAARKAAKMQIINTCNLHSQLMHYLTHSNFGLFFL